MIKSPLFKGSNNKESLSEAKVSAGLSTMLLNVSEFQNIEDATKALTSMSQAYQDMEKSEIIDKLNNIGNNFSISTSELAESLQKSAGTLKVAGKLYYLVIQKYIIQNIFNCR